MTCESQTATLQSCARRPGRGVHEHARCQRRRRSTAARCHARRVCNDALKKDLSYFKQKGGSPGRPVQDAQRAGKVADDRETWMGRAKCHPLHEGCKAAAQEEVPAPPAQKPPFCQSGRNVERRRYSVWRARVAAHQLFTASTVQIQSFNSPKSLSSQS